MTARAIEKALAVSALAVLLCAPCAGGLFAAPQKSTLPQPPDQFPALRDWIDGEIVEIHENGGVLLIQGIQVFGELPRGDALDRDIFEKPQGAWVELRYAKGWIYFDDLEGGPQKRMVLRDGRSRLSVGQRIEIGHTGILPGGYDRARASITNLSLSRMSTATVARAITFRGWILVRAGEGPNVRQ